MLFFGPPVSGKGTTALELGRVLSCEGIAAHATSGAAGKNRAPWTCACSACARHRLLAHPDMLLLGPRSFSGEIAASRSVFLREKEAPSSQILFIRSVRKLLSRFSPVLWEDDPRLGKLNPLLQSLEEDLDSLPHADEGAREKRSASILKDALKLEAEGIGDMVPVAQIRRAAYWGHLAPSGRRKLLVIENADRMQDGARNSLLKILEEPPERLTIVLTSSRREAILPTLLSRLRPYRFMKRDEKTEAEVIRKVYKENYTGSPPGRGTDQGLSLASYLDSFLPVPPAGLYPLGALFAASAAMGAIALLRRQGVSVLPPELVSLGKHAVPIAEAAGLGRPPEKNQELIAKILDKTENFEVRSLFPRFLGAVLKVVSEANAAGSQNPRLIAYNEVWKNCAAAADAAVGTWNQSPALTLERFITGLKGGLAELALGDWIAAQGEWMAAPGEWVAT
jgi:DNA polymerase-3 subunit gamma/tau